MSQGGRAMLSAEDLGELLQEMNAVTARLQASHETLQREVARLNRELREANESLERSRRLAALGEMAAGIAHEIRNPLGAIALSAQALERGVEDARERARIARRIVEGVRGLDAIVRDVLSFARDLRPRICPIDARALLDGVVQSVCVGELARGVDVEVRVEGSGEIAADGGLLRQALINIARNALEALARVGHERRLVLSSLEEGEVCVLRVSDSGTGIDARTLERMFNPFFTTRASGTGLGLAIVHRIVDAHRGQVRVRSGEDSELGRGTTFEIRLPRRIEAGRERPEITVRGAGLEHAA